jgi:hypothetical protein
LADPLFWLALSFLLVVVSLTAVLMVAIPALRELGRAARSAEKFFDTLGRDLPPTLEAIRLTGLEITELTDDVTEGVQSAGQVVKQVNHGLTSAQSKAKTINTGTKSLLAGAGAAWRTWTKGSSPRQQQRGNSGDARHLRPSSADNRNPRPAPTRPATEAKLASKPFEESLPQEVIRSANGVEPAAVSPTETSPTTNQEPQDSRHLLSQGEEPLYTLEEARNRADSAPAAELLSEPPPRPANQTSPESWQ